LHDKTLKEGNVSLSLLNYDKWLGSGMTTLDFNASYGNFYQPARYDLQPGVMGDFTCMSATRFAFDNLDTSEKFYLCAPYGVRAYPAG